jgi:outer membrane protein insertion porin family
VERFVVENGSHYINFLLRSGIGRDTRNRTIFADSGNLNQVNFDVAVPGSGVEYYTLTYRGQRYDALPYKFLLESNVSTGYVDAYGKTTGVPPYENFFAGGARTVRGYRDGTAASCAPPASSTCLCLHRWNRMAKQPAPPCFMTSAMCLPSRASSR